eukprot:XP_001697413.1 predicted protein [Chlamydomonas reinhardtii]
MARGQSQCPPCSRPLPRLVSSPQGMELAAGARAWFQVKARHARALSRGWMVSSPQGMELATVAMAFAIRLQPTVLAPFPRLDGVKPAGGLLARGLQSSRMVSSPQVGYWREDCSQAGWMVTWPHMRPSPMLPLTDISLLFFQTSGGMCANMEPCERTKERDEGASGAKERAQVAGTDGGAAGHVSSSLAVGGPSGGGGGEPGGGAGAAGMGPDPDMGGDDCDYGTILSAADVVALLADHNEAPSPGTAFEAVLQQVLWGASDQFAVCCRGTAGHALILRSLRGDVRAWEREWVADGGPPVCPRGLVPQLLEVAARADAELVQALWAGLSGVLSWFGGVFMRVRLRLFVRQWLFLCGSWSALLWRMCAVVVLRLPLPSPL